MEAWTLFGTSFSVRDALIAMAAGAVVVLAMRAMRRRSEPEPAASPRPGRDLKPLIKAAETLLLDDVRRRLAHAGVFSIGAVDVAPANLAFWVSTNTDDEKAALEADATLKARLQQILREVGYPAGAIAKVALAFQSQEAVDRDFGGDWWAAIK